MNARVGVSGGVARPDARSPQEEKDQKEFAATVAPKKPEALNESFISSMMAARQPPRLPLDEMLPQAKNASSALFGSDIENFSLLSDTEVAGDLAELFIDNIQDVQAQGNPDLSEAFEYLGEVLANYEHLRLLRTGELG